MSLLDDLAARHLLADTTDRAGLAGLLAAGEVTGYCGYDPTASSLHVGNLVPTILLARLQRAGHRPIALVGGATGMIGDPSGKSDERNLLDEATLAANVAGLRAQLGRLLDFDGPRGAILANNADWFAGVGYLAFLRDVGKHLTVNYMTAKDSVRSRLEGDAGISYTEFSYMLLQAWDFVQLSRSHGCRLQLGGSDQWGNITAGCELSRKLGGPQLYGLTAPLLLDAAGQKMGKSASGERIWLDPARTSPFAFYQYWLNVTDADAPRLLRLFSLESLAELDAQLAAHDADRAQRQAQRALARTMTTWIHGAACVAPIEAAAAVLFGGTLEGVTEAVLDQLVGTVPTVEVPRSELATGVPLLDLLARSVADSKGAARRLLQQGGVYVNNVRTAEVDRVLGLADLATPTALLLRGGKKDVRLIRVVG